MASIFELFIQNELPLRPFVTTNPDQETVLVRRGPGPRQYEPVEILEGEFLTKTGGLLTSGPASGGGGSTSGLSHPQVVAATTWNVIHAFNSIDLVVQIFGTDSISIIPDEVEIISPTEVEIRFASPQDGKAVIFFV